MRFFRFPEEDGGPPDLRRGPAPEEDDQRGRHQMGPPRFHAEVFTNPLEMERFFDQQLDQMLRSFGFGFGLGWAATTTTKRGLGRPPTAATRVGPAQGPGVGVPLRGLGNDAGPAAPTPRGR